MGFLDVLCPNLNATLQHINSARLNGPVLNAFFGGGCDYLGPWSRLWIAMKLDWSFRIWSSWKSWFDTIQAQDLSFVSMLKFSSQSKATQNHQPPWSGWWSSPMKRRTRTWHIYGCPVPAHFFLNGHVNHHHVVQLIYYYIFTYCFMHYDTHTTYPHNISALTLPSLGQTLTCRRCGCFSKSFLLITFFLCFPSLLAASCLVAVSKMNPGRNIRNIWVRETSDMCTLHLPPQKRICK